jgi:hypothetical protein
MTQLRGKQFYFTAAGRKAAEKRARSYFVIGDPDITWLGVVSC